MSTFTKQFLLIFIGCSLHFVPAIAQTSAASYCLTPNLERGNCTPLMNCPDLLNLLQNKNLTQDDRTFLAKSQCGFTTFVWVCCPQHFNSSIEESSPVNNLPKFPDCGREYLDDRIYGGTATHIGEFPWMAQLQYTKSLNLKGIHCAGSLVHRRFVLTAAHCVVGRDIPATWRLTSVRLGEWDTTQNPDCEERDCAPPYQDIDVEKIIAHHEYNSALTSQYHDIALLKLATEAAISEFVSLICLPIDDNLRRKDFEGLEMDIAGWGRTEMSSGSSIKLKTAVSIWNHNRCHEIFHTYNISVASGQMCAGGKKGIDGCRGDSGGPLMLKDRTNAKTVWYLAGVISLGISPCGLEGWPGIYTRSGAYIDWIAATITSEL